MFKVTTSTVTNADGSRKVVAKGKGKQVTLAGFLGTPSPERHAEAAAQVLRKLDTVPQPSDIISCEQVGDTFLFVIA